MNKNLHQRIFGSSSRNDANYRLNEQEGYYKNQEGSWEINIHHFLPKTNPEMIWWWLHHLDAPANQRVLKLRGMLQLYKADNNRNGAGHISTSFHLRYKLPLLPLSLRSTLTVTGAKPLLNNSEYTLDFNNRNSRNLIHFSCQTKWYACDSGSEIFIKYILPGNLPEVLAILLYNYNYSWQQGLDQIIPQNYAIQHYSGVPVSDMRIHEGELSNYNLQMP